VLLLMKNMAMELLMVLPKTLWRDSCMQNRSAWTRRKSGGSCPVSDDMTLRSTPHRGPTRAPSSHVNRAHILLSQPGDPLREASSPRQLATVAGRVPLPHLFPNLVT